MSAHKTIPNQGNNTFNIVAQVSTNVSHKEKSSKTFSLNGHATTNTTQENSLLDSTLQIDSSSGVMGAPIPYTIKADSAINAILLGCFILLLIAISKARKIIVRQAKSFFNISGGVTTELPETTYEFRLQFFMVFVTCLMLSLLAFIYTQEFTSTSSLLPSHHQQMAIFLGVFVAYFIFKGLFYWGINFIFFDYKSNIFWLKYLLFIFSMEGLALFPLVLLHSYLGLSVHIGLFYLGFIIILVRILLFYKSYVMFFHHNSFQLQIILYFCALEIMPLLLLWRGLVKIIDCFLV